MFEGLPNFPDSSRFWHIVDKHQVSLFYTAPTAIRALMREGDGPVKRALKKTLRLAGSLTPRAWTRLQANRHCLGIEIVFQHRFAHLASPAGLLVATKR